MQPAQGFALRPEAAAGAKVEGLSLHAHACTSMPISLAGRVAGSALLSGGAGVWRSQASWGGGGQ